MFLWKILLYCIKISTSRKIHMFLSVFNLILSFSLYNVCHIEKKLISRWSYLNLYDTICVRHLHLSYSFKKNRIHIKKKWNFLEEEWSIKYGSLLLISVECISKHFSSSNVFKLDSIWQSGSAELKRVSWLAFEIDRIKSR